MRLEQTAAGAIATVKYNKTTTDKNILPADE
jgi:hypothetical protein